MPCPTTPDQTRVQCSHASRPEPRTARPPGTNGGGRLPFDSFGQRPHHQASWKHPKFRVQVQAGETERSRVARRSTSIHVAAGRDDPSRPAPHTSAIATDTDHRCQQPGVVSRPVRVTGSDDQTHVLRATYLLPLLHTIVLCAVVSYRMSCRRYSRAVP